MSYPRSQSGPRGGITSHGNVSEHRSPKGVRFHVGPGPRRGGLGGVGVEGGALARGEQRAVGPGRLREGGDAGMPLVLSDPDSPAGLALRKIADEIGARSRGLAGRHLGLTPR